MAFSRLWFLRFLLRLCDCLRFGCAIVITLKGSHKNRKDFRYLCLVRIHFIAIGGSVMHRLAIALKNMGHEVSGSDDVIYEPALSALKKHALLPPALGWYPDKITTDIDLIILGKHAAADNPELQKAQTLGIPIQSFAEWLRHYAKHKQRVVIAGSYGKSTVSAMLVHLIKYLNKEIDFVVGAGLVGDGETVRLNSDAPVIVLEGDEYPSSALDPMPKLLHYKPHILVLNGIAWDHLNVYPTPETYVQVFEEALMQLPKAGTCIYNEEDRVLKGLVKRYLNKEIHYERPFRTLRAVRKGEYYEVQIGKARAVVPLIGRHNFRNLAAAWRVAQEWMISPEEFLEAMAHFPGVYHRLQHLYKDKQRVLIRDFAHTPIKVQAALEALYRHYRGLPLYAVLELHAYSSFTEAYQKGFKQVLERYCAGYWVFVQRSLLKGRSKLGEDWLRSFWKERLLLEDEDWLNEVMLSGRGVWVWMSSASFGGLSDEALLQRFCLHN